jgi:Lar family restriction alleviation protein
MSEELKYCPFCGGKPLAFSRSHKKWEDFYIGCNRPTVCNANVHVKVESLSNSHAHLAAAKKKAIKIWNTRIGG